jgi:hypothetical protein
MHATADEIGGRCDPLELATAIVDRPDLAPPRLGAAAPASGDALAPIMMSVQNDEYNHVATLWTDEARTRKSESRKQREQVFQRIKVALARLGERDLLARLDKLPFNERIATLDRYLSAAIPMKSHAGKT